MAKVGILSLKSLNWHDVESEVDNLVKTKGRDSVNKDDEYCEWYQSDGKTLNSGPVASKLMFIDFITRKKLQDEDILTGDVYTHFTYNSRKIVFAESSYFGNKSEILLIASQGTFNAVSTINKGLGLVGVTMRKRFSFNDDFIEYLNTTTSADPNYNSIFNGDMQSYRRKAKQAGHSIDEKYKAMEERENGISEQFKEAAGVLISPPADLDTQFPSIIATVYKDNWISISNSALDESKYYQAALFALKRLDDAFKVFSNI